LNTISLQLYYGINLASLMTSCIDNYDATGKQRKERLQAGWILDGIVNYEDSIDSQEVLLKMALPVVGRSKQFGILVDDEGNNNIIR
jgi:hypothetical protein